ncbi:hypothetical protein UFOVP395_27 [uncultured Caudovirales phage]|jgi:hypothetical protein|uniref:Uncharacterized protein n=1 Tax=uncultured Caudovirales phage TaxID=2100421 RepID=A0A6J5M2Q4_9CAUD|nr:hypothetical protein UFOVP395_27 [uncultured Caudovirales phage]
MATKIEMAVELYKQNEGISNADFMQLLMTNLGMTQLGARTYCYNVRKQVGAPITQKERTKKAPVAKKPRKAAAKDDAAPTGPTTTDIPYEQLSAEMKRKIKFKNVCA